MRAEAEGNVAQARREADEAISGARKDAEEAVARTRKEAEESVARTRDELEKQAAATLDALRHEHAEKVKALENDRDSRLAALEARAVARDLRRRTTSWRRSTWTSRRHGGELSSLREAKETGDAAHEAAMADVQRRLSEYDGRTRRPREEARMRRASAWRRSRPSCRARGRSSARRKQKLATESSRADKAHAKWDADRQSLERAKDALAVALAQIEEAEGRPLS